MNLNRFTDLIGHTFICVVFCLFMAAPIMGQAEEHSPIPAAASASAPANPQANIDSVQKMVEGWVPQEDHGGVLGDVLVPIVAIIGVFGGPTLVLVLLILMHHRSQRRLAEHRREVISKLIDAGKDVPDSLLNFDDLGAPCPPEKHLQRGLKNVGLGLGIGIFLWATSGLSSGTVGLILIGLGSAQILIWRLADKKA